jgi:hypothetical protein
MATLAKKSAPKNEVDRATYGAKEWHGRRHRWMGFWNRPPATDGKLDPTCPIISILQDWGVDPNAVYVVENVPVTTDSSCGLMARFDDGLWRMCYFGGMGGAPSATCSDDAYEGENGKVAWMLSQLEQKCSAVILLLKQAKSYFDEIRRLDDAISEEKANVAGDRTAEVASEALALRAMMEAGRKAFGVDQTP